MYWPRESDLTKQICYDINEIAMNSQSNLSNRSNLSRLISDL